MVYAYSCSFNLPSFRCSFLQASRLSWSGWKQVCNRFEVVVEGNSKFDEKTGFKRSVRILARAEQKPEMFRITRLYPKTFEMN